MTVLQSTAPITGRKVLYWFLGFFGFIFIANGFFIYFALTRWPGLVSKNAYQEGLNYNQTLAAAERQAGLNWQLSLSKMANEALTAQYASESGAPIIGLEVRVTLIHPVRDLENVVLTANETAPGVYRASIPANIQGRWNVLTMATDSRGNTYHKTSAMVIRR